MKRNATPTGKRILEANNDTRYPFFVVSWLVLELIAGIIGGRFERVFPVTKNTSNKTISRKRQKIIADRIREGIENSAACAIICSNLAPSDGVKITINLRELSVQEKAIAYLAMIDLFGPDIAKQDVFYSSYGYVAYSTPTEGTDTMRVYVKDFVE